MKKGILRQKAKNKIKRCSTGVQKLYESIRGSVNADYLAEALNKMEKLPQLNKEPIHIRNKKGVLFEIVGRNGQSRKYSVDFFRGVFYFDGNRLGKRKKDMVRAFYSDEVLKSIPNPQHEGMNKIWKKVSRETRL